MPSSSTKNNKNTRKMAPARGTRKVLHTNKIKSRIIQVFLGILNTVKLYHWKTYSYAEHKATDELYARLNKDIDKFVEILLGKDETRFSMLNKQTTLLDYNLKQDFKQRIYAFRGFLVNMSNVLDPKQDSDLLNVRDEILADINQFLYLMTFDK